MAAHQHKSRSRGGIRERGGVFQVRVYVGTDPVTGERVGERRSPRTEATVNELLDRWLDVMDIERQTCTSYVGKIEKHIRRPSVDSRSGG